MKKYFLLLAILLYSCEESVTPPVLTAYVTAKENVDPVLSAARNTFSGDAELAGIYGRNVNTAGQVDLLNTSSLNAFVYTMQSDAIGENEFYVPVYGAGPVKSPIDFNVMLSYVKDSTAKFYIGNAISFLATVHITSDAQYDDSPAVLDTLLKREDVIQFRNTHDNSGIDMFLFPSKAIDPDSGLTNSADWVVNFYGSSESLVLWQSTATGVITVLSN